MKPAQFIKDDKSLARLVANIEGAPHIALDTEANSLYAYYEKVCLIQLSVGEGLEVQDFIIDPLTIADMSPLHHLTSDPRTEIILHGAEYDIMSLKRDFGFKFDQIFDTHLAARTIALPKVGLGALLQEYFGVELDKRHQQADWGQRPLAPEMLKYAQMDTHYLIELRHILAEEVQRQSYWEELVESMRQVTQLPPIEKQLDEDGFWRIKTPRHFKSREMAILRELYLFRERVAAETNRPPFKVLSNQALVGLVEALPHKLEDIERVGGIPRYHIQRLSTGIFAAIERGKKAPTPRPRAQETPAPKVLERYDALQQWRKQKALERGVESDVILSKQSMWELAYHPPTRLEDLQNLSELGPYRRAKYGAELLKVLSNT